MPEQDRIVIASGQKDDPSSADNSLHPSPGPYRPTTRTSPNQHSVMFADNDGNEDRGTADLEMNHARFDTPPRVADSTTSFMSAIRKPLTREELQDCNSPKRDPGDILRVLSPSETFSPTIFHDQDQDQDGWNYGETGDGEDTKRESKKMLDKVSIFSTCHVPWKISKQQAQYQQCQLIFCKHVPH